MKVGDLVRIACNDYFTAAKIGIIVAINDYVIDVLWSHSGLIGWYEEDQLEVINEGR